MLPDVGMVQMYSKSANVNDLGFAWTGCWAPLFACTGPPLCSYGFPPGGLPCPSETHCTPPSLRLPLFLKETFYTPLFLDFLWMQIAHGQWLRFPNNSAHGNKRMCLECMSTYVAHYGMWLGGQPGVGCGGWVQDVLLLFG